MTKKEIEIAYRQHDALLHKLSHRCARRCGRPERDVYGQACYLFMKATISFDPARGSFRTYLYKFLRNELALWGIRNPLAVGWIAEGDAPEGGPGTSKERYSYYADTYPELRTTLTPAHIVGVRDWVDNLSDECREVALIIINGPAEILELGKDGCCKITAERIKHYLRKKGWDWPKVWRTIHDLKAQVASL